MEMDKVFNIDGCATPETFVSFIYGEVGAVEASEFEDHLALCESCTAALADISFARLDVYEWRRDEFEFIETPHFVVPYEGTAAKTSWLAAFRSVFSPVQWAAAGGGFAVIALAAGLWVFMPGTHELIATNSIPEQLNSTQWSISEVAKGPITEGQLPPEKGDLRIGSDREVVVPERQPSRISTSRQVTSKARAADRANNLRDTTLPSSPNNLRLNDFDDDEDFTLRLGDLLAEVDTRF